MDLLFDSVKLDIRATHNEQASFIGNQVFFDDVNTPIDIEFLDSNRAVKAKAQGVKSGSKFTFKEGVNIAIMAITTTVDQTIKYILSNGDVEFSRLSGVVSANIIQADIVGDLSKQTLNSLTPEIIVTSFANVARRFIFTADKDNLGSIYIGGAGVNADQCAIILEAGDSYIEMHACNAEFYAIADNDGDKVRIGFAGVML